MRLKICGRRGTTFGAEQSRCQLRFEAGTLGRERRVFAIGRIQSRKSSRKLRFDLVQLCRGIGGVFISSAHGKQGRCQLRIQILFGGTGGCQQCQRILCLLPLRFQRQGHGGQFRIRVFQPVAQSLGCRCFSQTRHLFRTKGVLGGFKLGLQGSSLIRCFRVARAQVGNQRLQSLGPGCGQSGCFGLGVHLAAHLRQGKVQGFLL